jgi:NADH-quinone oxidoreductase subunit F
VDEPVAIRTLKRFVADWELEHKGELPTFAAGRTTGKKVAVIGSGPAGLTAAHYLALKGYSVTVFEALPVAGGMLAVGIPEYRLPKQMLAAEIDSIRRLGVEIRTGVRVGKDITLEQMKEQGYAALFVAIGAHADQKIGIEGEDLEGVVSGVKFLRDLNLGEDPGVKGKRVAVIGGGNVAMDAARSALRLGAAEVTVVYRRRKEDMPAIQVEIDEAIHEGVKFIFLAAPLKVTGMGNKVDALECQRMNLGEFDKSGRRRPVPAEGATFAVAADVVIAAIGQAPEGEALRNAGIPFLKGGTVEADAKTTLTAVDGVFAGGDCVTGPDTVINAIAAGKKAAREIDKYLGGDGDVVPKAVIERAITGEIIEREMPRAEAGSIDGKRRLCSFDEVELGLTEEAAVREAGRCLRCDVKDA